MIDETRYFNAIYYMNKTIKHSFKMVSMYRQHSK